MNDDELARWRLEQGRQAAAMTPEQIAALARQQAIGMQNAMASHTREDLANAWAPYQSEVLGAIGPSQLPPLTLRQRITQWLSRFWS